MDDFLHDLEEPEAVIEGLYHTHTHDCSIKKSAYNNKCTIIKSNFYHPPFRIRVWNGSWNPWRMPVLCSFGHEKQGHFRQATKGVWRRMCLICLSRQIDQSLSRRLYITCRWLPIRKISNSEWIWTHPCQGRIRAISIWPSYDTRPRSIQHLCISDSQKVHNLKIYSFRWVPHTLNEDQKLARLKWQPQCWAFSNH
jgi:hypothetical protein